MKEFILKRKIVRYESTLIKAENFEDAQRQLKDFKVNLHFTEVEEGVGHIEFVGEDND